MNYANNSPVFDLPRPETGERNVQDSVDVVMRVDETDQFIRVPLRVVFVDDGATGWALEIGPYSIAGRDACELANSLEYFGQMSGDFHRADTSR